MSARGYTVLGVVLACIVVVQVGWLGAHPHRSRMILAWLHHERPALTQGMRRLPGGAAPSVDELSGRTSLVFAIPAGASAMRIELQAPLAGARVDAYGERAYNSVPLMRDDRIAGDRLELRWDGGDFETIRVVVHNHLRAPPALRSWAWFARPAS